MYQVTQEVPLKGSVAQVIAAFLLLILFTLAFPVYSGCYYSWMTSLLLVHSLAGPLALG